MIFITGGRSQGKRRYAREELNIPAERMTDDASAAAAAADGNQILCVTDYQEQIRTLLKAGEDPEDFTVRFLDLHPDAVIIMDEVGSGIVPIEKADRVWREACGRCGCLIADRADLVVRLVCGIPQVIKDDRCRRLSEEETGEVAAEQKQQ